jgi:hypothetical protein
MVCAFQKFLFWSCSHQNLVFIILCSHAYYLPYLHHSQAGCFIWIIFGWNTTYEAYLCTFLQLLFTSSLLVPNILVSILFSNTYSLCYFLKCLPFIGFLQVSIQYYNLFLALVTVHNATIARFKIKPSIIHCCSSCVVGHHHLCRNSRRLLCFVCYCSCYCILTVFLNWSA